MSLDEKEIINTEDTLKELENIIDLIKNGKFNGVISAGYDNHVVTLINEGDVDDRVVIIDSMFKTMYYLREKNPGNEKAFKYFMNSMHKRFNFYFSQYEGQIRGYAKLDN